MAKLKFKIIKNEKQYNKYCDLLEELVKKQINSDSQSLQDEIELLTLLIELWDKEHNTFNTYDPIELLKSFMTDHGLKAKSLVNILQLSKGHISDILNYKKGLSKETIRKLSDHFKVYQEAFNRPYPLISEVNRKFKHERLMNTKKDLELA